MAEVLCLGEGGDFLGDGTSCDPNPCCEDAYINVDFYATPVIGQTPVTVMFNSVIDWYATQYSWSFGDGDVSDEANPIHTYTAPGIYTVTLEAHNTLYGCSVSDVETKIDFIVVGDISAEFAATPTAGTAPLVVNFSNTSAGVPTGFNWKFGDGGSSSDENPTYQYDNPGIYTVSLKATYAFEADSIQKVSYIHVDAAYTDLTCELSNPEAKPGFDFWYYCNWTNLGVVDAANCTLRVVMPPEITFIDLYPGTIHTGSYSGYATIGDTLIVPLDDIDPTPWYGGYVAIYGNLPETAEAGDTLFGTSWLTTTTSEAIIDNNLVTCMTVVVASEDPNAKLAFPVGSGMNGVIAPNRRLYYVLQMENLPQAAADAVYIIVVDTLDSDLDWGTLAIGPMSHPDDCTCEFDTYTGVLTCFCDSIMLPPNLDPPAGEGYFSYWISPRKDLPPGTMISNSAWIRFDYNAWIEAPEDGPVIRTIGGPVVCGDANSDWQVNVADAVYLINYVFKSGPAPDPECAGDANGDGSVNVGDAVYLITYIFKGGPGPVSGCCP